MKLLLENWREYLDEVTVTGGVGKLDAQGNLVRQEPQNIPNNKVTAGDVTELIGALTKLKGPIIKMIAKAFKSPINAAKMGAFYLKDNKNLKSLLDYFAGELHRQKAFGGKMPTDAEITNYINKNSDALIKMGVMHYNKETGSNVKLENETPT